MPLVNKVFTSSLGMVDMIVRACYGQTWNSVEQKLPTCPPRCKKKNLKLIIKIVENDFENVSFNYYINKVYIYKVMLMQR